MDAKIGVYGATGYTGKLIAAEAHRRGIPVVLAGRDAEKLKRIADPYGFQTRVVALTEPGRLRAAIEDLDCVLHVAGPFSETSRPMLDACLATKTHYLDITGEIDIFEAASRRGAEAAAAGIMLLPGAGFDVVPSDCLAAHVATKVEEPTTLRLAIAGMGASFSRGTAKTMVEGLADGLRVRRNGIIRSLPSGCLERRFDFGAGEAVGVGMPWGDVATAFHSTGIPNIEVYFALSGFAPALLRASRFATPLLRLPAAQRFLKAAVDRQPEGPDASDRDSQRAVLLAEVEGRGGEIARARLETPNGYSLTAESALELACRAANGEARPGYQTPSSAYGADFVLGLEGCTRTDVSQETA